MNRDMKSMLKDAMVLCAITLIAGLILSVVYEVTKTPIALQKEKAKQEACKDVFQDAASFAEIKIAGVGTEESNTPTDAAWAENGFEGVDIGEVLRADDADGNILGYVITVTTHEGYSGDIQFMMGVKNDGTLNGISLLAIAETAGLGMRAEEVLKPQFENKKADAFTYTKSGAMGDNQIDAISGATITTNAVTNGVNAGLYYFRTVLMTGGNGNES